ncbi:hypothetical protein ACKKBF_B03865 [Auxenochlorella protothecoides x Auxenochlorella symbiontica]
MLKFTPFVAGVSPSLVPRPLPLVGACRRNSLLSVAALGRDRDDEKPKDSAGKKPQGNWRQFSPKSEKPGRQLLDTLELVYATTQWPSDDTIQSFWVLHRMPRHQVVEWFAHRRRQERVRPQTWEADPSNDYVRIAGQEEDPGRG